MGNMYMRRVKGYSDFISQGMVNEGLVDSIKNAVAKMLPWLKQKLAGNALKGWAGRFFRNLADGKINLIKNGPNKGKPAAMLFIPENGSIEDQLMGVYGKGGVLVSEAKVPLEYYGPDESIRQASADDIIHDITISYRMTVELSEGRQKPIFVYGAPGIGKTQIVAQCCDKLKCSLLFLDIQNYSPEDLIGVPTVVNGKTIHNPPDILPSDNSTNDRGGIIFLDEMNRADPNTLKKLLVFLQSGRIGTYQLPSKWIFVAAGNRPGEADVVEPDAAMADRFTIVNYVPDLGIDEQGNVTGGWAKHVSGKIMPEILAFLSKERELFHYMEADKINVNFPTARSWTDTSNYIKKYVKLEGLESWRDLPMRTIQNIVNDNVGTRAAAKFTEFLGILREVSQNDMEMALNNPTQAKVVENFKRDKRYIYALAGDLMARAGKDTTRQANVVEYIDRYGQNEMTAQLIKQLCVKEPDFKNKARPEFSQEKGHPDYVRVAKILMKVTKDSREYLTTAPPRAGQ